MPTGLPLDLDNLLAPIPGDAPAGDPSAYYALRSDLDRWRTEVNPDDFGPDDPGRPEQAVSTDWEAIEDRVGA